MKVALVIVLVIVLAVIVHAVSTGRALTSYEPRPWRWSL